MKFVPRVLADGRAVALGGYVHRVNDDVIRQNLPMPSAAADLGGAAELTNGPYAFRHGPDNRAVVSYDSSSVRTWHERDGIEESGDDAVHTVHSKALLKGLSVDNRLFVERANAYLKTVYRVGDAQPTITPVEADIEGLTIDGVKFRVTIDRDPLVRCGTCNELHDTAAHDEHYRKWHASHVLEFRNPSEKGPLGANCFVCSLVERLEWEGKLPEGAEVDEDSHVIVWPDFGKIVLGEMLVSDFSRRLTMIRLELGSPFRATMAVGDVVTTGQGLP
jgi:hypothetical protein